MCRVCVDFIKGSLTITEALRNLGETVDSITPEHEEETRKLLAESCPDPYEQE